MAHLTEIQENILKHLKELGVGASSRDIAGALGLRQTTTQEHLVSLASTGLIYYKDHRGIIGRPKRKYYFSSSDFNELTTQYSWLSSLLLEELSETLTPDELKALLSRLALRVSTSLDLAGLGPDDRLQKLAGIMNDLGYNVSFKQSVRATETILEAKSCVYHKVAVQHPQLCQFDIKLLENVSQKSVQLQSCIARGGKVCRFCVV